VGYLLDALHPLAEWCDERRGERVVDLKFQPTFFPWGKGVGGVKLLYISIEYRNYNAGSYNPSALYDFV
jgi:hypothetical protein